MARKKNNKPSKNEVAFFRVGLVLITLTIVVAVIIMLVSHFMKREKEQVPFEDEFNITIDDLANLMHYDEANNLYVVEIETFKKYDNYDEIRPILLNNNIFYIYLFNPEEINSELETLIDNKDLKQQAFFFLNTDKYYSVFEDVRFAHIEDLKESKKEMLLVYNTEEQTFEILTNHERIIETIEGLN